MKKKDRNGLPFNEWLAEEMRDPEFRKHYEAAEAQWLASKSIAAARKRAKLTQTELAKRIKTDQKAIWRLESGRQNATIGMLSKIAKATNCDLRVELLPRA